MEYVETTPALDALAEGVAALLEEAMAEGTDAGTAVSVAATVAADIGRLHLGDSYCALLAELIALRPRAPSTVAATQH